MVTTLKYPQTFVNSGIFSTSLVQYADGNNRTTDIDFVAENYGFLTFGESKTFRNNQIRIPLKQFTVLSSIYDCYPRSQVYIIGANEYSNVYDENIIWYTDFNLIRSKRTPYQHSPDVCFSKYDMLPITRSAFSKMINRKLDFYADPFEKPKEDNNYASMKVGNIEM